MYKSSLHFHFTGIGGVGMSGLAEVLLHQGFKVSGSDLNFNESCRRLEKLGAVIKTGHSAENLPPGASLLVYSSAVRPTNPELVTAHERHIPVIPRAEVLAELMRLKFGIAVAGSHGKTTTTSFIAHVLETGNLDPTVVLGGQVKSMGGSGAKLGQGSFLVAESDESDRSFLLLKPTIAVVTNIDSEHLDAYSSMSELEEAFQSFIDSVPFYGLAVLCTDDPRIEKIWSWYQKRKVSFGLGPHSDYRAVNVQATPEGMNFDIEKSGQFLMHATIPMYGRHMVSNSLAAVAVGVELGIAPEMIGKALETFPGVARRLERIGQEKGVTVLTDYGHHPTEIRATLGALRQSFQDQSKDIHVIFQPHRYSRTKSCFVDFVSSFGDCDNLILTDIYPGSEDPIPGVTSEVLLQAIDHPSKKYIKDFKDAVSITKVLNDGDIVLCLGAGSIGQLPALLLEALKK